MDKDNLVINWGAIILNILFFIAIPLVTISGLQTLVFLSLGSLCYLSLIGVGGQEPFYYYREL